MQDHRRPQVHSNLEEKNEAGGIPFPGFRLYYEDLLIQTVWIWYTNRPRNRTGSPETKLRRHCPLVFNQGAGNTQRRGDRLTSAWCRGVEPPHAKEESGAVIGCHPKKSTENG